MVSGETCAYCGIPLIRAKGPNFNATDDHVVPQCLFLPPLANVVQIPA